MVFFSQNPCKQRRSHHHSGLKDQSERAVHISVPVDWQTDQKRMFQLESYEQLMDQRDWSQCISSNGFAGRSERNKSTSQKRRTQTTQKHFKSHIKLVTMHSSYLVKLVVRAKSTTKDYIRAENQLHSISQIFCIQVIKQQKLFF